MAAFATAPRTDSLRLTLKPLHCYIPCAKCGAHETPGLTLLTATGDLLCRLCADDYETGHLTSQDLADEAF